MATLPHPDILLVWARSLPTTAHFAQHGQPLPQGEWTGSSGAKESFVCRGAHGLPSKTRRVLGSIWSLPQLVPGAGAGMCLRRVVRFPGLLQVPLGSQQQWGQDHSGSRQDCCAQCMLCMCLSREDLWAPVLPFLSGALPGAQSWSASFSSLPTQLRGDGSLQSWCGRGFLLVSCVIRRCDPDVLLGELSSVSSCPPGAPPRTVETLTVHLSVAYVIVQEESVPISFLPFMDQASQVGQW